MGPQDAEPGSFAPGSGPPLAAPPPPPGWQPRSRLPSEGVGPPPASAEGEAHAPVPAHEARLPPTAPTTISSLRWLYRYLVVGGLALAGASALRLLDDWEAGRWWMADVVLVGLALVCGVLGVIVGVGAVGEGLRHRSSERGEARAIIGLVLAIALTLGAGLRAADDWYDSDIDDAIDRFEIDDDKPPLVEAMDAARAGTSVSAEAIRTGGREGGCYTGSADAPGEEVRCREPHTLQVVGFVTISIGDRPWTSDDAARMEAVAACTEAGAHPSPLPPGAQATALAPTQFEWEAGDENVACLVESEEPREGSLLEGS